MTYSTRVIGIFAQALMSPNYWALVHLCQELSLTWARSLSFRFSIHKNVELFSSNPFFHTEMLILFLIARNLARGPTIV